MQYILLLMIVFVCCNNHNQAIIKHPIDSDIVYNIDSFQVGKVVYVDTRKVDTVYIYSSCNSDTVYIHDTVLLKVGNNVILDSLIQRYGFPQRRMLNNWTIDTLYY